MAFWKKKNQKRAQGHCSTEGRRAGIIGLRAHGIIGRHVNR
jgi:hypothetical protein